MGANNSKESVSKSKVFLPKTPTEFSPGLIAKLDSSVESDFTRRQYSEKYIQDKVYEELQKLEVQSKDSLTAALQNVSHGQENDTKSAVALREQISELKNKLDSRPQPRELTKELTKVRETLTNCLRSNQSQPLKCWDELEQFKHQVKRINSQ